MKYDVMISIYPSIEVEADSISDAMEKVGRGLLEHETGISTKIWDKINAYLDCGNYQVFDACLVDE